MTTTIRFLTPPAVAKHYGVSAEKVIAWIKRGELRAVDVSDRPGIGRPRFRIDPADLIAFENARSAAPMPEAKRRRRDPAATEYF